MRKKTTNTLITLVPLSELAGVLGMGSANGLVADEDIVHDWKGAPCVRSDVAGAIVAERREAYETRKRLEREREELAAENADARELVRAQAYREAYDRAVARAKVALAANGPKMSAQTIDTMAKNDRGVIAAATEAAAAAVAEYDRNAR